MINRKSILFTWEDGNSRKGKRPTAKELEALIDDRCQRVYLLLQTTPLMSFSTVDFWDFVAVEKIDHYLREGSATPYDFEDDEMFQRQIEHVLRNRFGVNPMPILSDSVDKAARQIVRYIEASWADELWAA